MTVEAQQHLIQIGLSSGLFILLWIVLGNIFFKPFFGLLEEREARTSGAEKKAIELQKQTRETEISVENSLRDSRKAGMDQRDAQVARAKADAQTVVQAAADKTAGKLEAARDQIRQTTAKVERELESEVDGLAGLVFTQVLGEDTKRVVH